MNRRSFGTWGANLDDDAFAQALAALGVVRFSAPVHGDTVKAEVNAVLATHLVEFALDLNVDWVIRWNRRPREVGTEPERAEVFQQAWQEAIQSHYHDPRLEINPSRDRRLGLDRRWLVNQLSRPVVGASSVYVRQDEPSRPISWNWPVRIGLLNDQRSRALRKELSSSPFTDLFEVKIVRRGDAECDLLLLPSSLRNATQTVLTQPVRLQADCVIVMGSFKVGEERAYRLIEVLRSEVRTSGVAVLSLPSEIRAEWFTQFIVQLSHNRPLDVALFQSGRSIPPQQVSSPPFVTASRQLMEFARLEVYTQRLGRQLLSVEPARTLTLDKDTASKLNIKPRLDFGEAGARLLDLPSFHWVSERGDATSVVRFRSKAERSLGRSIRLPRVTGAAPAPTLAKAIPPDVQKSAVARVERRLQSRFVEADTGYPSAGQRRTLTALFVDKPYVALVRIAHADADWVQLAVPFPIQALPPSEEGHTLTVVFTELRGGEKRNVSAPQLTTIHLPQDGDSQECEFFIHTPPTPSTFRARIIVLHENRVLQTAILSAPVLAGESASDNAVIEMVRETVVRPNFEDIASFETFDAALVLNHAADETPGITTVAGNSVSFYEPVDLKDSLDALSSGLGAITSLADQDFRLDDQILVNLLRQLSGFGSLLWKMFLPRLGDLLASAARIQVVEAREGALLPIEFFYEGKSPVNDATLCGHALKALAAAVIQGKCPNIADDKFTCPTDFWGFSRVIERRPHSDIPDGKEYQLSEPSSTNSNLDILSTAVFAASEKVRAQDKDDIVQQLKQTISGAVSEAKTWQEVKAAVAEHSPSLLVLLPHSLPDPQSLNKKMAALELGGEILNISQLDVEYVCGPERVRGNPAARPGPAVLLLGCSTDLTTYRFQNFVSGFQRSGASLVVGTLSTIRGRHAVDFVKLLLEELSAAVKEGEKTFGDTLLRVKRHMLADGDPFSLTLTAYGDAGWTI